MNLNIFRFYKNGEYTQTDVLVARDFASDHDIDLYKLYKQVVTLWHLRSRTLSRSGRVHINDQIAGPLMNLARMIGFIGRVLPEADPIYEDPFEFVDGPMQELEF